MDKPELDAMIVSSREIVLGVMRGEVHDASLLAEGVVDASVNALAEFDAAWLHSRLRDASLSWGLRLRVAKMVTSRERRREAFLAAYGR